MLRRPQKLCETGNLEWIMNNLVEPVEDWETECWNAISSKQVGRDGRAYYWYNSKLMLMYRATWEMWWCMPFPENKVARHLCNNSSCVNPLHIEPGTHSENEADKCKKLKEEWNTYRTKLPITPLNLDYNEKVDFWLKEQTLKDGSCKIFLGSIGTDGYGRRNVVINNKRIKIQVHRWAYCVKNNKDYFDKSWVARHTCNNRSCINPDHIQPGTRSQNSLDSISYSKAVKLTEQNVREIIEKFLEVKEWPLGSKKSFSDELGYRFRVSPSSINNIVFRKRNWKNLLKEYNLL